MTSLRPCPAPTYQVGTWVVDTATGDLGEVMRQAGGLLSLQRPARGGLWSVDPGAVRLATAPEIRAGTAEGAYR